MNDLSRAEVELDREETALRNELVGLVYAAAQIDDRLKTLKSLLAESIELGVSDASIVSRAETFRTPAVDNPELLEGAKRVREDSLKLRKDIHAKIRQHISDSKQQLPRLAQQLEVDAKAVSSKVTEGRARKEAAVRPRPPSPENPSKRGAKRVKMLASVDLTSDNNFYVGFSSNISDGGVFIATIDLLPIGTEVDVTFSLPSGEKIDAKGVVRWIRESDKKAPQILPGIGIQFTSIHAEAQDAVNQFVSARDPLFYAE